MNKIRESPGATHSLLFLGKRVGIPEEFHTVLRKLSLDFVITRYPDAAQGLPYELYDEGISKERLALAERVLKWVKKAI